jgi:L-amino acid N-acyltransferase YncA|tara:strand:- start:579 stop:1433 length:855 start_codon:yes stop_codon:yes gene_type:complete
MLVRHACSSDSLDILTWRNDKTSRKNFLSEGIVSQDEHNLWFASNDRNRTMYIGESDGFKVGICRFDFNERELCSKISINMNPAARSKGLGKIFLQSSIEMYLDQTNYDLKAEVKIDNIASKKIFSYAGFELAETNVNELLFRRNKRKLQIKQVGSADVDALFELLKKRKHSISHTKVPSYESHKSFIESNPYMHWYLISLDQPVGTFYIQSDNSIGLNFCNPTADIVKEVLGFLKRNFKPQKGIPSKVPPYFYINVSVKNLDIKNILDGLKLNPIQVSYKFNF